MTLNSETLNNASNGRKISLPRSIPREAPRVVANGGSTKKSSFTMDPLTGSQKRLATLSTRVDAISKPRRRVLLKERSKSAGVSNNDVLHIDMDSIGRSSLPPVSLASPSSRNVSTNLDRHIQSAPPLVRGINLPSVLSPGKSDD